MALLQILDTSETRFIQITVKFRVPILYITLHLDMCRITLAQITILSSS